MDTPDHVRSKIQDGRIIITMHVVVQLGAGCICLGNDPKWESANFGEKFES